ncbi:tetratricopeptide repeat-containing glycosyltransferase [Oceanicaulis alexandrii]|uniref:tetratricopeptide repeat-containing glycosyltransferase n=1 Tax=Oceanicaulis alexandrii TaxID=153233 RepID=UPI0003F631BB|nr:glycosyltransferase [Oceanicaulis alexandrii]
MTKYSIVIPTKNRGFYAIEATRSALSLDYDDFEIIVHDCSPVDALSDKIEKIDCLKKVKYFHRPDISSMTENWEAALNQTSGQYVCVIGDDDAILPDALLWADFYLGLSSADVLRCPSARYKWPDYPYLPMQNTIRFTTGTDAKYVDNTISVIENAYSYKLRIGTGPGVYRNFVSRQLLEKIKSARGAYILDIIPDFDSGYMNLAFGKDLLEIERTLFVSGAGGKSQSGHIRLPQSQSEMYKSFAGDAKIQAKDVSGIDGVSITSNAATIISAQLRMKPEIEKVIGRELNFNNEGAIQYLLDGAVDRHDSSHLQTELELIGELAEKWSVSMTGVDIKAIKNDPVKFGVTKSKTSADGLVFVMDCDGVGANTVHDASQLVHSVLPGIESVMARAAPKKLELIHQTIAHARKKRADAQFSKGQFADAEKTLKSLLKLQPEDVAASALLEKVRTEMKADDHCDQADTEPASEHNTES